MTIDVGPWSTALLYPPSVLDSFQPTAAETV
jgi:hypothetical protein